VLGAGRSTVAGRSIGVTAIARSAGLGAGDAAGLAAVTVPRDRGAFFGTGIGLSSLFAGGSVSAASGPMRRAATSETSISSRSSVCSESFIRCSTPCSRCVCASIFASSAGTRVSGAGAEVERTG